MRFTKEQRQQIIVDFARRHKGEFNPRLFFEEVRDTGKNHSAYEWFEWDRETAFVEHNIWRAREFANGLQVKFSVQDLGRSKMTIREVEMPFAISPMAGREDGGGYIVTDPNDPEHLAELCGQAATDLSRWIKRYSAAVIHAGGSVAVMEKQLRILEAVMPQMAEAAE